MVEILYISDVTRHWQDRKQQNTQTEIRPRWRYRRVLSCEWQIALTIRPQCLQRHLPRGLVLVCVFCFFLSCQCPVSDGFWITIATFLRSFWFVWCKWKLSIVILSAMGVAFGITIIALSPESSMWNDRVRCICHASTSSYNQKGTCASICFRLKLATSIIIRWDWHNALWIQINVYLIFEQYIHFEHFIRYIYDGEKINIKSKLLWFLLLCLNPIFVYCVKPTDYSKFAKNVAWTPV